MLTPPADLAEAGDDAVTREALFVQPEGADLVRGQRAEFLERTFVQQQGKPLARGELAARMLLLDAFAAAAQDGATAHLAQRLQVIVRLVGHCEEPFTFQPIDAELCLWGSGGQGAEPPAGGHGGGAPVR